VNRLWQQLFGQGLVGTPDNFGSMGDLPTNPDLLDYLASEFMREGWSSKKMLRRLLLSGAYQLGTDYDEQDHAADPANRYFWRMNRKRLDAESLRDAILAVNGSLDLKFGGPSLSGDSAGPAGLGVMGDSGNPESTRRSVYLAVFRGALSDLFQVFDFPDPYALAGKRYVTTAPTQALFLMNSPFILRAADLWAEKLSPISQNLEPSSESELIDQIYLAAYARPPSGAERQRAQTFLRNYSASLVQIEPDAAARKSKALRGFCQAILESTEFRFLN
jgi:uncharacterized protein DUF1553